MVDAFILPSEGRLSALRAAGQIIPSHQRIRAFIDTGASGSCVDPSVLRALGLVPTGVIPIISATTGAVPVDSSQYDIGLIIPAPNGPPFSIGTMPVTEHEFLAAQGFHALIGRDVLSLCLLSYNGAMGFFTLAY